MSMYMESLKLQDNYTSLKARYLELQARAFPSLAKKDNTDNNLQSIDNLDNLEESEEQVLPISPVEERDAKIDSLQKQLDKLNEEIRDTNNLKETVTKL